MFRWKSRRLDRGDKATSKHAFATMAVLAITCVGAVSGGRSGEITSLYGLGNMACGDWIRASGSSANELRDWVLGYVSGLAASGVYPRDVLKQTSPAAGARLGR
jgi:hypothetical protein